MEDFENEFFEDKPKKAPNSRKRWAVIISLSAVLGIALGGAVSVLRNGTISADVTAVQNPNPIVTPSSCFNNLDCQCQQAIKNCTNNGGQMGPNWSCSDSSTWQCIYPTQTPCSGGRKQSCEEFCAKSGKVCNENCSCSSIPTPVTSPGEGNSPISETSPAVPPATSPIGGSSPKVSLPNPELGSPTPTKTQTDVYDQVAACQRLSVTGVKECSWQYSSPDTPAGGRCVCQNIDPDGKPTGTPRVIASSIVNVLPTPTANAQQQTTNSVMSQVSNFFSGLWQGFLGLFGL